MPNKSHTIPLIIAALLAAMGGFWASSLVEEDSPESAEHAGTETIQGLVLKQPRRIGIPDLEQSDGSVFNSEDLAGGWSLLFFGYTNCPDICPTTLSTLASAKQASKDFPRVIFVSVDPERDDAALLKQYVTFFDPSFIGVTGDGKLLQAMAMQMSVASFRMPEERPGEYLVDHSANLMLLDADARLVAMIRPPHTVDSIRQAVETLTGGG